jgi:hypothetical protein
MTFGAVKHNDLRCAATTAMITWTMGEGKRKLAAVTSCYICYAS